MRIFAASPGALQRGLDFLADRGRVVSLVGGGGKSTVMLFLAQTCARQGKKVLLITANISLAPSLNAYVKISRSLMSVSSL